MEFFNPSSNVISFDGKKIEPAEIKAKHLVGFLKAFKSSAALFDSSGKTLYIDKTLEDALGGFPLDRDQFAENLADNEDFLTVLHSHFSSAINELPKSPIVISKNSNNNEKETFFKVHAVEVECRDIVCLLVLVDNISCQMEIQKEIERLNQLSVSGQTSLGIAHELNNILTSITGWAQIARQNIKNVDTISTALGIIEKNIARTKDITSLFLKVGKPGLEDYCRPVSLQQLLRDALKLMSWEFSSRNIEVVTEFEETKKVFINETRIFQVIVNLLKNAFNAMGSDGKIIVSLKENGEMVTFGIEDTGPGMTEEVKGNIFNPFFSTNSKNSKSSAKGSGLGLMICRKIVKEHNGVIKVELKKGVGAKFCVSLLAALKDSSQNSVRQTRSSVPPGAVVLVVDDEKDVCEMIKTSLTIKNAQVTITMNGIKALEMCRRKIFSAAFIDFSMPGLSGHELKKEIHKIQPELPIIFMSGLTVPLENDNSVADFIKKPFGMNDVQYKLNQVLK